MLYPYTIILTVGKCQGRHCTHFTKKEAGIDRGCHLESWIEIYIILASGPLFFDSIIYAPHEVPKSQVQMRKLESKKGCLSLRVTRPACGVEVRPDPGLVTSHQVLLFSWRWWNWRPWCLASGWVTNANVVLLGISCSQGFESPCLLMGIGIFAIILDYLIIGRFENGLVSYLEPISFENRDFLISSLLLPFLLTDFWDIIAQLSYLHVSLVF